MIGEILVLLESVRRSHSLADAIGLNCKIRKARENKIPRSLLVVRVWMAQVHGVDLAWRVFCLSCTPNLFYNGSILTWRVAEMFFLLSSSVSSSIIRLGIILCLHLSFLLFKLSFYY